MRSREPKAIIRNTQLREMIMEIRRRAARLNRKMAVN